MKRFPAAAYALAAFLSLSLAYSSDSGKKGEFLSPSELAELGEKSKIAYGTKIVKSAIELPKAEHPGYPKAGPLEETRYPEISVGPDGSRGMHSHQPSEASAKAMKEADKHFQAKEYDLALPILREALVKDPKCYLLHLNMGDCFLFSGNPVAALDHYDKAMALNPNDYHVHWFRGSALLDLGKPEEARHSYARALAMSPRNPSILKAINGRSDRLGVHAKEELFHPLAVARRDGDEVTIYTVEGTHWWVYGLCKGIWLAEEGHRKDLTGETNHTWTTTEELECMANLLVKYDSDRDAGEVPAAPELDDLLKVLDAHDLGEFVDYEFGSRVTKDYVVLLGPERQEEITRFVERFVFQKQ